MIQKNKPAWTVALLHGGLQTCGHTHHSQAEARTCRDNQDEPDDWIVVKVTHPTQVRGE